MPCIPVIRRGLIALLPLVLAACATVGPDYRVPPQAALKRPAAAAPFAGTADAPAGAFGSDPLPAHWWRLYHDPVLDRLVDRALRANTDLRVAAANLERAQALLGEARQAQQPAVSVKASPVYGREAASTLGLPQAFPDSWMYDGGVGVSYQVDLFGKIRRALEAAGADTQAARAAYDAVRVSVAAGTARAYAGVCSAGRQLAVAGHSVELQQEFVRLTERRVQAGRGTDLDLSRARAQLEQLQAALPPLQAKQRSALYQLAVLTGETPNALPAQLGHCDAAPRLTSPIPVGDGAALLRRRPDIRQAERKLAAAVARIGVATADLYPSISIGLNAGSVGELADLGAANTFHWSLGPLISWNLPSTGTARVRIAQARAGSRAALALFDGTVLNALRETETALTVYARELDRNAALRRARDQSTLAASQAGKLYRYGRAGFLTALDVQRQQAAADSALAASDAQLVDDQVALFLALGGGWEQQADNASQANPAAR